MPTLVVTFNGQDYPVDPANIGTDGKWTLTIPQADLNGLGSGQYPIEVNATDAAGNLTTVGKDLTVDLSQTAELKEADYKVELVDLL
ncbi:Ig-like domain-containing protein, partial [Escherichia coli]